MCLPHLWTNRSAIVIAFLLYLSRFLISALTRIFYKVSEDISHHLYKLDTVYYALGALKCVFFMEPYLYEQIKVTEEGRTCKTHVKIYGDVMFQTCMITNMGMLNLSNGNVKTRTNM